MRIIFVLKKFLSFFILITLLTNYLVMPNANANASPWTRDKAEHLAKRTLIGVDNSIVDSLYNAGSAQNAVNLIFPSQSGPDRSSYNNSINSVLTQTGFDINKSNFAYQLYQMKYFADPYEAKRKLFMVFEDIFSSNNWGGVIKFKDIDDTHELIYSEILGNYKNLIKKILYNNGQSGDFTEGKFLDLFNQTNKRSPNENYARELLQLFLMDEYKPLESKDLGNSRNYEETDVASLAKILFGYKFDENSDSHIVYYEAPSYTGNDIREVAFLTGILKSGSNFPFYNTSSGTINLEQIQSGGGLSLRDNIIEYIFSKRENEIALFLANKLARFYISESLEKSEIQRIADELKANNFELFPSIKWLLSSDLMYSDKSINELRYKNPIELAIGGLKVLNQNNKTYIDPIIYNTSLLSNIGWTPYTQTSIFGRDGFDKNDNFYNANLQNKWISFLPKMTYSYGTKISSAYSLLTKTTNQITTYNNFSEINPLLIADHSLVGTGTLTYVFSGTINKTVNFYIAKFDNNTGNLKTDLGDIKFDISSMSFSDNSKISFSSGTFLSGAFSYPITNSSFSPKISGILESSLTMDEIIGEFEQKLLLGKNIDSSTKLYLKDFLSKDEKGNSIIFDSTKHKEKIEGLASIIMSLPEFVLNSGFSKTPINSSETSFLNSTNSKLIMVDLGGGYDYLYNFFPAKNKDFMPSIRPTLYRKDQEIVQVGDYYMSNSIAFGSGGTNGLKYLYDNGYLKVFNRTGTRDHSRDHDQASKAIQSCDSYTINNVDGTFGKFIKNEVPSNTMVIGNSKPYALRGGKYINIGGGGNILNNERLTIDKKNQILNIIRTIGNNRLYPGNTRGTFKDAITIDSIGNVAKSNTPRDGAGNGNTQNYDFIKAMIENGYGKAFYLNGDGGYDTHDKQAQTLDNNISKVVTSMVSFFDSVKDTQDVTIVLFSEFGRTIKENGGAGTDHGKAGVMWVLTSNNKLRTMLPQNIYGDLDLTKEKEDLLGVGIYYDSVYAKIVEALYSKTGIYSHNLEDDIDNTAPKINNFNTELKTYYGQTNNFFTNLSFDIDSKNFEINAASHVEIKYGTGLNSLKNTISNWELFQSSNSIVKGKRVNFTKNVYGPQFAYQITVRNNQYSEKILTGIINTAPHSTGALAISPNNDTFLSTYKNGKIVSGNEILATPIFLGNVETNSGTTSTGEVSSGSSILEYKNLTKGNGNNLIIYTGTTNINTISGSGIWNGRFILGDNIDKNLLFGTGTIVDSGSIDLQKVAKVIKYGSDALGVSLKLDKNVGIETSSLEVNKSYNIYYSEDLKNWKYMTYVTSDNNGKAIFTTNHFTYFAFVDSTIQPSNNSGNDGGNSSGNTSGTIKPPVFSNGGGGGGGISRDYCPAGDYSKSYYDRTCGIKPINSTGTTNITSTGTTKNPVVSNPIINTGYEKKYINYKGIKILDIKNYPHTQSFRKMAFDIVQSKKYTTELKKEFINRLNSLLEAKFTLDTDTSMDKKALQNRVLKQQILLNAYMKRKM